MQGWLIWAYDTAGDQYLRCATVLANSIKATQRKNNQVAVVVNRTASLSSDQIQLFDFVIPVQTDHPTEVMCMGYELSPFHETISLEADSIVCTDLTHWWNFLGQRDILFPGQVLDARGCSIQQSYYRKHWAQHALAPLWSGLFYWQRSMQAANIFKKAKNLCDTWRKAPPQFEWTDTVANDEIFSHVLSSIDLQQCIDSTGAFTFRHIKPRDQVQYCNSVELTQQDFVVNSSGMWIGPWKQQGVVHYHTKTLVNNAMEQAVKQWAIL